jgi:REP element-mobilizing transposase RayT
MADAMIEAECRIAEGYLMPDHVHVVIAIPPKYSMAQGIGGPSCTRTGNWPSR